MNRLLYIIFPPYAIYVFLFKSNRKWYLKLIVSLLFLILVIISVDMVINPHRVEESLAQKQIHENFDKSAWGFERLGVFPYKEVNYAVYRAVTTEGLHHVVLTLKQGEMEIKGVYRVEPDPLWVVESNEIEDPPLLHLALYLAETDFGELVKKQDTSEHTINTTKGTFFVRMINEKEIEFYDEEKNLIEDIKIGSVLPKKVERYFEKHQDDYGKIEEFLMYEVTTNGESFYIETSQGLYRVDHYINGDILLLEGT